MTEATWGSVNGNCLYGTELWAEAKCIYIVVGETGTLSSDDWFMFI